MKGKVEGIDHSIGPTPRSASEQRLPVSLTLSCLEMVALLEIIRRCMFYFGLLVIKELSLIEWHVYFDKDVLGKIKQF